MGSGGSLMRGTTRTAPAEMPELAIPCDGIGESSSSDWRGRSETHGQTLGQTGSPVEEREKGLEKPGASGTSQENPQKRLAWLTGIQSLSQQPVSLHGTNVGSLHISDSSVVWSDCGLPGSGSRCSGWLLGTYSSHWIALPSLSTGEVLSLMKAWKVMFGWCPGDLPLSQWIWRRVGEGRLQSWHK